MIDVHSHILPQMDDGSASVEETLTLLSMLKSQGAEKVVATPHFYAHKDNLEPFLQRRAETFAQIPQREDLPQVLLGAEVAYFNGISQVEAIDQLHLGDTKLLLIEMPFTPWTAYMVRDVCDISVQRGLVPVIAHANRYPSQLKQFAQTLLSQGVLFQCNADAFSSFWNRRWALKQIAEGNIHFLGSDCHNLTTRPPLLTTAKQWIEKKLGQEALAGIARMEKEYFG